MRYYTKEKILRIQEVAPILLTLKPGLAPAHQMYRPGSYQYNYFLNTDHAYHQENWTATLQGWIAQIDEGGIASLHQPIVEAGTLDITIWMLWEQLKVVGNRQHARQLIMRTPESPIGYIWKNNSRWYRKGWLPVPLSEVMRRSQRPRRRRTVLTG